LCVELETGAKVVRELISLWCGYPVITEGNVYSVKVSFTYKIHLIANVLRDM
jgi:hypothetical protein